MANLINSSLIPNVTEIYLASDGTILDETNKSTFHAQSNYANLLSVFIEDGNGLNTTTLINFSPTNVTGAKKALYTSHWFFMRYQGIVQKTINNEIKSFAHFYIVVPNIVLRNNGTTETSNTITVIQRYGSNFLGTFDTLNDLPTPTEALADSLSTAYVIATPSFYQVQLVESAYQWVEVEQLAAVLQTKQYNTFTIDVQKGLSSTFDVTPINETTSAYIMQIIADLEAQQAANADELENIDGRMDNAEIDIDALQADRLLKDGSNADNDITIRDVTFNLNVDTDAIQQTDLAAFAEAGKTNLNAYIDSVQAQLDDKLSETDLLQTFYNKTQTDALLDEKLDVTTFTGHTHTESDITDLDKYSTTEADEKFMAIEDYTDANDKILFSKLPDAAKSQTLVKATFAELPTTGLLAGDKAYITTTGDSFIWDGNSWETLADADWQNVNLDWGNITNRPTANGGGSLASATLYTKAQADTLLAGKSNVGHTHLEADITDLDKYTQQEVDAFLSLKSDIGHTHLKADITDFAHTHVKADITDFAHTHVEADITDLDKYTQLEVDNLLDTKSNVGHIHDDRYYTETETNNLLNNKVDKNISVYTEVTEFNESDTYYVYQDGAKKVNLANLKAYLTSELTGVTFQLATKDAQTGLPDVANPLPNTIYLVTSDNPEPDFYFEYLWLGDKWEYLGSTNVDLTNYYNKEQTNVLLDGKADIGLLSSNITLYPTTAASDISGYGKMVTSPDDEDYNDTAADVPTGAITTNAQLLATLASEPGLFTGNPGIINVPTIGNIRKTAGNNNQYAEFYFELYKRDSVGTEVLIGTSDTTGAVNPTNSDYREFSAYTLFNNGIFASTDRIVIKYYANLVGSAGAEYDFQFGGTNPVRTLLPVPVSVLVSNEAIDVLYDNTTSGLDAGNVNAAIDEVVVDLSTHATATNNPHSVTASQVGLGSVLNYGIASQADAEAGAANDRYMTPLRTAQAIAELSPAPDLSAYDSHIADSTIHFTQSQIQITESQITDFGSYEPANANIQAHISSTSNPHSVTATQVGLGNVTNESKATMFTNPAFTGIPTAPTASTGTNTTQVATTAFVQTAVSNLVDTAPEALNTLNELAAALGDDPNFATTVSTSIGTKADKAITISAGAGLTGGGDLSANRTISHADTSSQGSVNNSGFTYIQDVTLDTYGHITGLASATWSHPDTSSQASVNNSGNTFIQDITLDDAGHITALTSATVSAATTVTYTGTIDTSWSGSSAPFTRAVTVSGITSSDNPIIDVTMSGTYATDDARNKAWSGIYRAVTGTNSITFYASVKPTVSLPFQAKVVR